MSEYVMVRRDVLRARLRRLETVIAADNDDHDALADVRGWMETVLSQSSACKVCGGGGYVIADPPDGVGDCPACNTAIAQPEAQPVSDEAIPPCRVADVGFRWDGETQVHVPTLLIEFEPVPANGPCDAPGWKHRDALAVVLALQEKKQ